MLDTRYSSWDQARRRTDQKSRSELVCIMVLVRCYLFSVQRPCLRLTFLSSFKRKPIKRRLCARSASHFLFFSRCQSSLLFFFFIFAVQGALRASPAKNPPLNMHGAIQFNGEWMFVVCHTVFFIREKRTRRARRERNERMNDSEEQRTRGIGLDNISTLPSPPQEPLVKD